MCRQYILCTNVLQYWSSKCLGHLLCTLIDTLYDNIRLLMIHGLSISTLYRSQTRPEGPTNTSTSTVAMASTGPTATPKICSTQASVFHGNLAFSAGIWWSKTGKATIVRISHYKTDPSVKERDTTSNGCVLDSPQYVCSALFGFASHTTRAMVAWNLQSCLVMNRG